MWAFRQLVGQTLRQRARRSANGSSMRILWDAMRPFSSCTLRLSTERLIFCLLLNLLCSSMFDFVLTDGRKPLARTLRTCLSDMFRAGQQSNSACATWGARAKEIAHRLCSGGRLSEKSRTGCLTQTFRDSIEAMPL